VFGPSHQKCCKPEHGKKRKRELIKKEYKKELIDDIGVSIKKGVCTQMSVCSRKIFVEWNNRVVIKNIVQLTDGKILLSCNEDHFSCSK